MAPFFAATDRRSRLRSPTHEKGRIRTGADEVSLDWATGGLKQLPARYRDYSVKPGFFAKY